MQVTPQHAHRRAIWTLVFCALCWSIAGVFTRHLERAEGFEVTFWRSLVCALFVAVALVRSHGRHWWRPVLATGRAGLISGVMWSIMFTCFMLALSRTTVANTLVVMAISPLLAALLAWAVLREQVPPRTWAAIAAAAAGIVWMVRGGLSTEGLAGMAIASGVPIAAAINIVTLKRIGASVDLAPAVLIGGVLSCIVTLPLAWPLDASTRDLTILATLGVVQLGLPCMLMVSAARYLAPHEIALLALLEVVFGPIWAWLGAGERPSDATLQGGLIVLAALVCNELFAAGRARALPAR